MVPITTFVFFDIETTGLPYQERNLTKITEASFLAAHRDDIEATEVGNIPLVSKLTFVLNPRKAVSPESAQLTGLSNQVLRNAPVFKQKFATLYHFLNELPPPVCLVAHNGNSFDFKILLAECNDAGVELPNHLLCADSLNGFRKLLKGSDISYKQLFKPSPKIDKTDDLLQELLTDDEDDSFLNCKPSLEEAQINGDYMYEEVSEPSRAASKLRQLKLKSMAQKEVKHKNDSFKLIDLYRRLLGKDEEGSHRAEVDCNMLLQCVVALKNAFLPWADNTCKHLTQIEPLVRH